MKKTILLFFLFSGIFLFSQINLDVIDTPNDDGSSLQIDWQISNSENGQVVLEKIGIDGEKKILAKSDQLQGSYTDGTDVEPNVEYTYILTLFGADGVPVDQATVSGSSRAQWFNTSKIALLIMIVILTTAIVYYIYSAKSGKDLYIRKINGLESMDESVGRATEMGKPILFVPGILDLD
nr:hypothetical protein [Candidatus Cloacimonadota bacterium]